MYALVLRMISFDFEKLDSDKIISYTHNLYMYLKEEECWELLRPVCRELDDLVRDGHLKFLSGHRNENEGTYVLNLESDHLHFASRGIRDSIGDVMYDLNKMRIGLRSGGIPINVFVTLTR